MACSAVAAVARASDRCRSPTSFLARSSCRVTEHATPAAALLAADDEAQPTLSPRVYRALVVEPIKHPRQRPAEPSPRRATRRPRAAPGSGATRIEVDGSNV